MTNPGRTNLRQSASRASGLGAAATIMIIAGILLIVTPRTAHSMDTSVSPHPFDGCGTVIVDELYYCYLFQADSNGKIYAVPGIDSYSYNPGDRLHVQGMAEFAVSFCTLDGHILEPTILLCDEGCAADLDGNGSVDVFDLLALLSAWGPCGYNCPADLDGNGVVDVFDLLAMLAAWGPCP